MTFEIASFYLSGTPDPAHAREFRLAERQPASM